MAPKRRRELCRHTVSISFIAVLLLLLLPAALYSAAALTHADLRAPPLSRLAHAGIRTGRAVELRGRTLSLRDEFVLPAGANLTIRGGALVGDGHTLFKLPRNRARLVIEDCDVRHLASPHRPLRRELGGAIFALANSRVTLINCTVSSEVGYGLWLVQRASASLTACRIAPCGRSGVVLFGRARLDMAGTAIDGAGLHGICARGDSRVSLIDSVVSNTGVRGIYAYHNATLSLERTRVEGTRDASAAAVQIEALRPEDRATLRIDDGCVMRNNAGEDLRVSGRVDVIRLTGGQVRGVQTAPDGRQRLRAANGSDENTDHSLNVNVS
jgi:hypothetical protein